MWPIFPMLPFQVPKEDGVGLLHIATSPGPLTLVYKVYASTPVLLNLWGVLFSTALYGVVSEMNSCVVGIMSACGVYITPVLTATAGLLFAKIIGSVGVINTGTSYCITPIIRPLNNFWWEIPSELPESCSCTSLAVALFVLFLTSFIFKFVTLLIR